MLDAYMMEWGSLLIRWLHVITAIAWIGSSFFFMHLDASLRADPAVPQGKGGSAWQVHGGGFYMMRKYFVAPDNLPSEITWHKWQSYWTWISGFMLLCWIYYAQASLYLIDPTIMPLSHWQASGIGIGALALGWVVYDQLCKSPLGRSDALLAVLGLGFVVLMAYGFTQVFSGRGAMIHTGALMATFMSGNVFFIIMPNQRKVIGMMTRGEVPDAKYGKIAKQRSAHNNYITLPVLFMMLSNHYPMVWANSATIPLITALVIVAGAIIRHFYNVRHTDHARSPWWAWGVAAAAILAAAFVALYGSPAGREIMGAREVPVKTAAGPAAPPHVTEIVLSRCSMCHADQPVWDGIHSPPKGVKLDTPERIGAEAAAIRIQAVLSRAMPPNNLTDMTAAERRALSDWLKSLRS